MKITKGFRWQRQDGRVVIRRQGILFPSESLLRLPSVPRGFFREHIDVSAYFRQGKKITEFMVIDVRVKGGRHGYRPVEKTWGRGRPYLFAIDGD